MERLWSLRIVSGFFFAALEINQPSSKRNIGTLLVYKHVVPNGTKSRLRDSPNRPRDNFIVFQLRFFLPAGDQNLRARMIKRHQHASVPAMNLSRVFLQIQFMIMNLFSEQLLISLAPGLRLAPEGLRGLHSAALVIKISARVRPIDERKRSKFFPD